MNDSSNRSRRPCPIATGLKPPFTDIIASPKNEASRSKRLSASRAQPKSVYGEIRNLCANLAVIAHRPGVERQEGVLVDVLWNGLACRGMKLQKARLVLENRFDESVGKVVRQIGAPDREIV